MSSVTKQKSHAGRTVFVFFLVFTILVAAVVIGLSRVFKNKDVTPSIAGYSLYIMDSDRMLDNVPRGSLVLASNELPSIEKVGKAVLCEEVPGVGTSVFWLADVSAKEGQDGVIYTVYQEKNTAITYQLKSKNVVGEATTYYTWAGKVITFMTSRFGMVICIGTPIALLIIIELIIAIASSEDYDDEDDDEDDDDDDEPEIEKPVSIDDFLFSGDDATPLSRTQLEEDKTSDDEDEPEQAEELPIEEAETAPQETEQEEAEQPQEQPEPDEPAYEEKAEEPEPPKTEPKPAPKPKAKRKKPETSLEDLVKLMEQQQQKLRDEMNKK